MASEVSIWTIEDEVARSVTLSSIDQEQRLQEILARDISILDRQIMVIGREVPVGNSGRIDILAIDPDGSLVVVELKRGRTPRDVVAQALDYGSWISEWGAEEIQSTFVDFQKRHLGISNPLLIEDALRKEYGFSPEDLNGSHRLVIVATELDPASERIVSYLQEQFSVPVSVETFHFFVDGGHEFLVRNRDEESELSESSAFRKASVQEEWNGEYYANFGANHDRPWLNGKRYGFIRAGGGARFKRFLEHLPIEGRVWVKVPGSGFVGVGLVIAEAVPYKEFVVSDDDGTECHLSEIESDLDPNEDEYVVAVKWLHVVNIEDAVKGRGLFGNQNTVAQPRVPKWQFTVDFLKQAWEID